MSEKIEFLKDFFNLLNKNTEYAVLRNYEKLPEFFDSHDLDILINKKDFLSLKKSLKTLFELYNFKILMINENERFVTIIIAKYINNELKFLYIDFFFNYSLYGVLLIESKDILKRRKFNGKIYHVNIVDEFLEKYLNVTLLNKEYPQKYSKIYKKIIQDNFYDVNEIVRDIFYFKSIDIKKLSIMSGKKLLFLAFARNLIKKPFKQIKLIQEFIFFYIKGWFYPNGLSISITGPDGSGKTTIIMKLEKELKNIYREVIITHFRPNVIPRIARLLQKIGLKNKIDEEYHIPHRGEKTSKFSSYIRLIYYSLDYIIGYLIIVKPVLVRRGIVIFDRYYTDIISDSKRSRIYLDYKLIFLIRKIIPRLNYNFIIFVDPQVILQRKQELNKIQIEEIYKKLNYICKKDTNYIPIENNDRPEKVLKFIINYIILKQDQKYRKFFDE